MTKQACRPGTPPAPDFSAAFPQRATPFPPVQTTPKSISDHECNASTTARQRHVGSHITGEVTSAWGGRIPCELLGISHAGLPRLAPRVVPWAGQPTHMEPAEIEELSSGRIPAQ
jgi:hypothetical protein